MGDRHNPSVRGVGRLVHDATLVTVALAIAIGWALFQVAEGVGALVTALLTQYPPSDLHAFLTEPLTWDVGGRILTLSPLLRGLVEFAVVVLVALVVTSRTQRRA